MIEIKAQRAGDEGEGSARLGGLLAETSRTFALSIPFLRRPLRDEVTIAYLLFRIADTIEDEVDWGSDRKASALRLVARVMGSRSGDLVRIPLAAWAASTRVAHPGYARLMREGLFVLDAHRGLEPAPRGAIAHHLARTARGMADQLESGDAPEDIREYCYSVAGIVGELCTELFIGRNPSLLPVSGELMALAPAFGQGLQLVNILRDRRDDAGAGRVYLPGGFDHDRTVALAIEGLAEACAYVRLLEQRGADPGTVAFNALNVTLAFETLALVVERGPGAKLGKARVGEICSEISTRAERAEPIALVPERSASVFG